MQIRQFTNKGPINDRRFLYCIVFSVEPNYAWIKHIHLNYYLTHYDQFWMDEQGPIIFRS